MDKIKLTEDEIKDLTDVRTNFQKTTLIIGETEIGIINLKNRKEDLIAALRKLDEKQSEIAKKLEDKYGKGSISLDTNEFTPTQE
jgi:phosphopantetheine adenylyltransferase